jgi:hypothetical protein
MHFLLPPASADEHYASPGLTRHHYQRAIAFCNVIFQARKGYLGSKTLRSEEPSCGIAVSLHLAATGAGALCTSMLRLFDTRGIYVHDTGLSVLCEHVCLTSGARLFCFSLLCKIGAAVFPLTTQKEAYLQQCYQEISAWPRPVPCSVNQLDFRGLRMTESLPWFTARSGPSHVAEVRRRHRHRRSSLQQNRAQLEGQYMVASERLVKSSSKIVRFGPTSDLSNRPPLTG